MDRGAGQASGPTDAARACDWPAPAASGPVRALVRLPGSKSMTNRALVLAALADGPTTIRNPLLARDTELMAAALRALGAQVTAGQAADQAGRPGTTPAWLVTPAARGEPAAWSGARGAMVDVGNAGTVLRFVPPVAALTTADVEFRGDDRASARPVGPLLAALRELGAAIDDGGRGAIPFTVRGHGGVSGGTVTLDASASSQLVSGLLLAAPRYDKGAEIRHDGPRMPSAPHLAMTTAMLREAGAEVETGSRLPAPAGAARPVIDIWRVHPGPLAGRTVTVEPDLSSAGPFLAAALVTAGTVTVAGWPGRTTQPPRRSWTCSLRWAPRAR